MADQEVYALKDSILSRLLLPIVLGGFLYYLWIHPDLFAAIRDINYINVGMLAGLGFLMLLSNSLMLRIFLYPFNIRIPVSECFGISSISAMGNYIISFGGGTVGKAVYLKRRYYFSYPAFLASMSAAFILDLLLASFLGSSMVILTGNISSPWGQTLLAVSFILGVVSFMVLFLDLRIYEGRVFKVIRDALDGWNSIRRDRGLLAKVSLLLLANHMFSSVELIAGYSAFSIKISIADAILLGAISSLASIMRFTPANIGLQEAVIASCSHLLGIGFSEGLLAAALLRVVSMGIVFSFGGLYMMGFGYRLKGQEDEGIFSGSR